MKITFAMYSDHYGQPFWISSVATFICVLWGGGRGPFDINTPFLYIAEERIDPHNAFPSTYILCNSCKKYKCRVSQKVENIMMLEPRNRNQN